MADITAEYLACPIRNVLSRFGDKWSLLVLFLLNRSDTGVMRFNEIRRFMTDCSQKMLTQTLRNLEQSHLVHREVFAEVPPRVEYSLTEISAKWLPTDLRFVACIAAFHVLSHAVWYIPRLLTCACWERVMASMAAWLIVSGSHSC